MRSSKSFLVFIKSIKGMSYEEHFGDYIQSYTGGDMTSEDRMAALTRGATCKRLRYKDLIAGGPAYPAEAD